MNKRKRRRSRKVRCLKLGNRKDREGEDSFQRAGQGQVEGSPVGGRTEHLTTPSLTGLWLLRCLDLGTWSVTVSVQEVV